MHGYVWLCMAMWAMYGFVGLYRAMYGCVGVCRAIYGFAGLCRSMLPI